MKRLFAAAFLAAIFVPATAGAITCGPKEPLESFLKEKHNEALAFTGMASDGNQLRLYLDPDGLSWSLVLRPARNPQLLCPLSDGHGGSLKNIHPES